LEILSEATIREANTERGYDQGGGRWGREIEVYYM
jgi:hypothetical protein